MSPSPSPMSVSPRPDLAILSHPRSRVQQGWLLVTLLTLIAGGCGKPPKPWEKVHPAKGVVNFKGKPLGGAQITLVSQNAEFPEFVRPSATSKDDGTFELGTYSIDDGAPAGAYKAIVLHYPVVGPKENPSPGRNDLPSKYARAETTDLTVEVSEGKIELQPLELR